MSSIQHEHLKHRIKQLKLLLKTEIIDSIGYNRVSLASRFKHFGKKNYMQINRLISMQGTVRYGYSKWKELI